MKRSKRLQTIVDIKARQEQFALDVLGQTQKQKNEVQRQVEGLTAYRSDYIDKCNAFARDGVKVSRLVEFRGFIDKLDVAIAGQEKLLQRIEQDVQLKKQVWEFTHRSTKTIQKVRESALKVEKKIEDKREQFEQDERASRFGRAKATDI
jgi:flagellar FliJ protein